MKLRISGKVRNSGPGVPRALLARNATVDWDHFKMAQDNRRKRLALGTSERKIVFLFVSTPDGAPAITKATFDQYYHSNARNVRNTLYRATNKAYQFAAPGYGADKYSVTIAASLKSCDYQTWVSQSIAAAQKQGMNLENYNHVSLITGDTAVCNFCGLGIVDCTQYDASYCWTQIGCGFPQTIWHELGHNLGMHHSGTNEAEYGDGSCIMGMGTGMAMVNLIQRVKFGWLRPGAVKTVSTSGSHTIYDAWNTGTTYPLGLRVEWAPDQWTAYFVSWRYRSNEDPDLLADYNDKVSVHYMPPDSSKPLIVCNLAKGESCIDQGLGLTITYDSSTPSSRTARVTVTKTNPQ